MLSQPELNAKVLRGLRTQFSQERSEKILTQAESMYLQSQFQMGSRNGNKPEVSELFEGGWIDRTLEFLGFGQWAIGRPKNLSRSKVTNDYPKLNARFGRPNVAGSTTQTQEKTLEEILDLMIPDPLPRSYGPYDNAIAHLSITVFGKPNTGKTTIANTIYAYLRKRYGAYTVYAVRSSGDLFSLLDNLPTRPYRAVLLFLDDMTKALERLSRKERAILLGALYDIRGALSRTAGMREGLVIVLSSVHRFYANPIDLRADNDLLLVRSTGTPGTFDARTVRRMLGKPTWEKLRRYETMALRDRKMLGWTGWASKSGSGVVYIPPAHEPIVPTVSNPFDRHFSEPTSSIRLLQPWLATLFPVALVMVLTAMFLGII